MAEEPKWSVGRHDWRDDWHCQICGATRGREEPSDSRDPGIGDWLPCLEPCKPRLLEPFPGFLSSKELAARLGIGYASLITRIAVLGLRPVAVSPQNAYYWREYQLVELAAG